MPESEVRDCPVIEARRLSEALFLLVLDPGAPLVAAAGQFAMLRPVGKGTDPLLARPMSILESGARLSFLIRRCGRGSEALTSLRGGDLVTVLAPLGHGWGMPRGEGELLLIAGGVGVAPLLFASCEILAATGRSPTFLYGAKTKEELVLLDELEAVSRLLVATDDGSQGRSGLVTTLLREALADGHDAELWTCGPELMMRAVARIASERKLRCRVSVEARMACGRGLCLGCAREDSSGGLTYVCREGPVFEADEIYPSNLGGEV